MTASFASQEWADSLAVHLNDDARVRTDSMTWVFGPVLFVIDADAEHGFDATGLRIDVHEGEVRSVTLVDPAVEVARVPTAFGGSLARWKSIFSGSLTLVDGVREAKVRLRGDLPTLQRHHGLLDGIARSGAAIVTSWPDDADQTA